MCPIELRLASFFRAHIFTEHNGERETERTLPGMFISTVRFFRLRGNSFRRIETTAAPASPRGETTRSVGQLSRGQNPHVPQARPDGEILRLETADGDETPQLDRVPVGQKRRDRAQHFEGEYRQLSPFQERHRHARHT